MDNSCLADSQSAEPPTEESCHRLCCHKNKNVRRDDDRTMWGQYFYHRFGGLLCSLCTADARIICDTVRTARTHAPSACGGDRWRGSMNWRGLVLLLALLWHPCRRDSCTALAARQEQGSADNEVIASDTKRVDAAERRRRKAEAKERAAEVAAQRVAKGLMSRSDWLSMYGSDKDKAKIRKAKVAAANSTETAQSKAAKRRRHGQRVHRTNAAHTEIVDGKVYTRDEVRNRTRHDYTARAKRNRTSINDEEHVGGSMKSSRRVAMKICDRVGHSARNKSTGSSDTRSRSSVTARCLNRTEVEVIRQAPEALQGLVAAAKRLQRHAPKAHRKHVIITASNLRYRGAALNWIHHMNLLNIKNYVVLCFDADLFGIVGEEHGVLMRSRIAFDYNKKVTRAPRGGGRVRTRNTTSSRDRPQRAVVEDAQSLPTHRRSLRQVEKKEEEEKEKEEEVPSRRSREVHFDSNSTAPPRAARKSRSHSSPSKRPPFSAAHVLRSSKDSHFYAMMVAKYEAIQELTSQGYSVIWSDTDALWLRPCGYQHLLTLMDHRTPQRKGVDMAGQKGRQPVAISDLVGSCLCTGLFLTNPTTASAGVLAEVIDDIVEMTYVTTFEKRDDQALLNDIIYQRGGLYFEGGAELRSFALPDRTGTKRRPYGGKPMYGINSSRSVDYTFYNTTMVSAFKTNLRGKRQRHAEQSFTLALLPYALFPRGVVNVPGNYYMNKTEMAAKAKANREKFRATNTGRAREEQSWQDAQQSIVSRGLASAADTHFDDLFAADALSGNTTDDKEQLSRRERGFRKNVQTLSEYQRREWQQVRGDACIWHLISTKEGDDKARSMLLDGVYKVPPQINTNASTKFSDLSSAEVQLMRSFLSTSFAANNGRGVTVGGGELRDRLSGLFHFF